MPHQPLTLGPPLRVPLNPEFFRQGADFLGIFWADRSKWLKCGQKSSENLPRVWRNIADYKKLIFSLLTQSESVLVPLKPENCHEILKRVEKHQKRVKSRHIVNLYWIELDSWNFFERILQCFFFSVRYLLLTPGDRFLPPGGLTFRPKMLPPESAQKIPKKSAPWWKNSGLRGTLNINVPTDHMAI